MHVCKMKERSRACAAAARLDAAVVRVEMSSTLARGEQTAAAGGTHLRRCVLLRKAEDADDLAQEARFRQLCHTHDVVELQTGKTSLTSMIHQGHVQAALREPAG